MSPRVRRNLLKSKHKMLLHRKRNLTRFTLCMQWVPVYHLLLVVYWENTKVKMCLWRRQWQVLHSLSLLLCTSFMHSLRREELEIKSLRSPGNLASEIMAMVTKFIRLIKWCLYWLYLEDRLNSSEQKASLWRLSMLSNQVLMEV